MKKLSLAMALIMIIAVIASTLGMTGFATDAAPADAVASIGDTTYTDIFEAIAALKDGDTLKLLKDITFPEDKEGLVFDGAVPAAPAEGGEAAPAAEGETDVPAGDDAFTYLGSVTLDGNGKTITSVIGTALVVKDMNVTVNNLTIKAKFHGVLLNGQAFVTLNNCNVFASNVQEGQIPGQDADGKPANWLEEGGMALNIPATAPWSTLVVNGGKYYNSGKVEVAEDGTVKYTGRNLMENRGGTLIINDGEFISYNGTNLLQVGGNTASKNQSADWCATQVTSTCWIYGGTFALATAQEAHTLQTRVICAFKGSAVNIFGGNFINNQIMSKKVNGTVIGGHSSPGFVNILGGNFYSLGNGDINELMVKDPASHFLKVYGGTFYATAKTEMAEKAPAEGNDNFINGYANLIEAADAGKYTASAVTEEYVNVPFIKSDVLAKKISFSYNAEGAKASAVAEVTNPNGSVYYAATLYEAFNMLAMDGATIKLLTDVTLPSELIVVKRPAGLTIDGNGKKVSVAAPVADDTGYTPPAPAAAIRIEYGTYNFSNITVENEFGAAFSFGYTPMEGETLDFATYKADLVLENSTLTAYDAAEAYVVKNIYNSSLDMKNVVINGGEPKTEKIQLAGTADGIIDEPIGGCVCDGDYCECPEDGSCGCTDCGCEVCIPENRPSVPGDDEPGDDEPGDDKPDDNKPSDDGNKDDGNKDEGKKGCGGAIGGASVMLVLAAAGAVVLRKKD